MRLLLFGFLLFIQIVAKSQYFYQEKGTESHFFFGVSEEKMTGNFFVNRVTFNPKTSAGIATKFSSTILKLSKSGQLLDTLELEKGSTLFTPLLSIDGGAFAGVGARTVTKNSSFYRQAVIF